VTTKGLIVGVADMIATAEPAAEIVTFSLGSCLGITLYDPVRKIGGLLHLMLPDSKINAVRALKQPHMFVDTGVPLLFQAMYRLGADKRRLVVKVAGGAQFLDEQKIFNIGQRNIEALRTILSANGVAVSAHDVAGTTSRTMRLQIATGRVTIQTPGQEPYDL
jgi:chemotaxis protein CheD